MSIFNPYILLGLVLAIVGSFGGGYYKGSSDEEARQGLVFNKFFSYLT